VPKRSFADVPTQATNWRSGSSPNPLFVKLKMKPTQSPPSLTGTIYAHFLPAIDIT
jgi:hypothetical protein